MERKTATPDDQEADQALRDARSRFIAGFTQRHRAMGTLLAGFEAEGDHAPLAALREAAHKLAGLAGVLGFPTVSEHASALEVALLHAPPDPAAASAALARMGAGFAHDLAGTPPSWAGDATLAAGARILIVEDDQEQRRLAASGLRAAGYRVVTAESGSEAVETAQAERPDLILLDVDLPGLDGMAVCRRLKLNPALSSVPIIFCTARAGLMDRTAGLTLGADDYLTKPFAPSELLIRMRHLLTRAPAPAAAAPETGDALTYDLFAATAADVLAHGGAAVVLVRVAAADLPRVVQRLSGELRRRDVIGRLGDGQLVLIMPGMSAAAARASVRGLVDATTPPVAQAAVGAADTAGAGGATIEALIADADLSLAQDRAARSGDAGKTTILLAEDDADVVYILDARLRAAGYRTLLAFDGEQTLQALAQHPPAAIVLDLMMPKRTGFDVLMKLRERPAPRPRAIVLSARGRDEDITRAFALGADDYITKPFNPDELMARIARLIR